jgi:hypothetical protein
MSAGALLAEAGAAGVALRLDDAGAVRATGKLPPALLARLREHRAELVGLLRREAALAPILAAFPGAEVAFRPIAPVPLPAPRVRSPEPLPPLDAKALRKRRKWLARDTARHGLVNLELPGPRFTGERAERPPERLPPVDKPCVHCGRACPAHDLAESVPLGDGRWEHLTCWSPAALADEAEIVARGGPQP